jgi:hypothetical protein
MVVMVRGLAVYVEAGEQTFLAEWLEVVVDLLIYRSEGSASSSVE